MVKSGKGGKRDIWGTVRETGKRGTAEQRGESEK